MLLARDDSFHRHYGFLANRNRQQELAECRRLLFMPPPACHCQMQAGTATDYRDRYEAMTGRSLRRCPRCDDGNMLVVEAGRWVSRPSWIRRRLPRRKGRVRLR